MIYFIIIRGPLGIGKTTISKALAKKLKAEYISLDKVLADNKLDDRKGEPCIPARNFIKADKIILPTAKKALKQEKVVIFDGCFYHREQIEHLEKELPIKHFVFNLKAPVEVCIKRDSKRPKVYGKWAAIAVHKLVSKFDYGKNIDTNKKTEKEVVKEILGYISSDQNKYTYKKYDSIYPKLFQKEKLRLSKIVKNAQIEHVGSSAVPGLGGKGIIDIAIGVKKEDIEKNINILIKAGYEYRPKHPGNDKDKFFTRKIKKENKERRIHLHLTQYTGKFWNAFILFRDHLRSNKKIMKEYDKIKKEGAKLAKGDGYKYAEHKNDFIRMHTRIAMGERK